MEKADFLTQRLRAARVQAFLNPADAAVDKSTEGLERLMQETAAIYAGAVTAETRVTYARRWRSFENWCSVMQIESMPAEAETVMMYITDHVTEDGVALSTIRGWMAAINRVHLEAGVPAPGQDPAMGMFLRGLARARPSTRHPEPVSALRISDVRSVCRALDSQSTNGVSIRDATILVLHRNGVGDGEISRLNWSDVHDDGMTRLDIRAVRAGYEDRGVHLKREDQDVFERWREIATSVPEPVFTHVEPSGWREDRRLSAQAVFKVRKSRADSLGSSTNHADPDTIVQLLVQAPSEILRDKALVLVGFAGAFRRNELTELVWSDVREMGGGLVIHLRRSKTDLSGRGRDVGIPSGSAAFTCPVRAFLAWKSRVEEQLGTNFDPTRRVFTHVGRAGRISERPLSPEGLTRVIQRRALDAGIVGRWGGRSLRAGFISTAADLEIPLEAIARQSRHKTMDSLIRYIRAEPFRRNAATEVGL